MKENTLWKNKEGHVDGNTKIHYVHKLNRDY